MPEDACYGSNSCKVELVCASCHDMVAPGWQEHRTRALVRQDNFSSQEEGAKLEGAVASRKLLASESSSSLGGRWLVAMTANGNLWSHCAGCFSMIGAGFLEAALGASCYRDRAAGSEARDIFTGLTKVG